jgi:hypothetical protein
MCIGVASRRRTPSALSSSFWKVGRDDTPSTPDFRVTLKEF